MYNYIVYCFIAVKLYTVTVSGEAPEEKNGGG